MWRFDTLSSCRYETVALGDHYDRNRLLLEWVGREKHVLELGCSTGFFSRHLVERDCRVVGVEVDSTAAERAKRFCDRVFVADLASSTWVEALPRDAFDVVLMGDVLEHLPNPYIVLQEVRPLLHDSGCLIISLPNVIHWLTRLELLCGRFEYVPWGTLDFTHLRFFTPRSARALIQEAGYRISRFHPAIGGRMSGHFRPAWQLLANVFPSLFAYQMLFRAELPRHRL
jgi:2-polyprenyl-3-methyl-5-hydroxy-6-metoxy-1,4-benzoquinol methylase